MKLIKLFLIVALVAGYAFHADAKGYKPAKVYMFGFAASFNDSTVYFTEIQEVNAFLVNDRTHFLAGRADYSYQLHNFLATNGKAEHPTAVVVYAEDKKKINKKLADLKAKYTTKAKQKFFVEQLSGSQFAFQTVQPQQEAVETPAAKKSAKK